MELETALGGRAQTIWAEVSGGAPVPDAPESQRAWDRPIIEQTYQSLLQGSVSVAHQARLTSVVGQYAGAWLEATPSTSLGTKLIDEAVRVTVSLRLGVPYGCSTHLQVLSSCPR